MIQMIQDTNSTRPVIIYSNVLLIPILLLKGVNLIQCIILWLVEVSLLFTTDNWLESYVLKIPIKQAINITLIVR